MDRIIPTRIAVPPVTDALEHAAQASAVRVRRTDGHAEITWELPASVAFSGHAEATASLTISQGKQIPLTLRLLDGPVLQCIYGDHQLPTAFDAFRAFVSGPGLERLEMGGSSCAEGFRFETTVLGSRWGNPGGTLCFELAVD